MEPSLQRSAARLSPACSRLRPPVKGSSDNTAPPSLQEGLMYLTATSDHIQVIPDKRRRTRASAARSAWIQCWSCTIEVVHLADVFIESNLSKMYSGYTFFISMCVPWEFNPQPFALLTQCSTTEPQGYTKRSDVLISPGECRNGRENAGLLVSNHLTLELSVIILSNTLQCPSNHSKHPSNCTKNYSKY